MPNKSGETTNIVTPPGNPSAINPPMNILGLFGIDDFPASKMDLVIYAEDRGASEDVLEMLQAIPDDIYDSFNDLNSHLGEMEIIEDRGDLWASEESHDLSDDRDRALADFKGKGRL